MLPLLLNAENTEYEYADDCRRHYHEDGVNFFAIDFQARNGDKRNDDEKGNPVKNVEAIRRRRFEIEIGKNDGTSNGDDGGQDKPDDDGLHSVKDALHRFARFELGKQIGDDDNDNDGGQHHCRCCDYCAQNAAEKAQTSAFADVEPDEGGKVDGKGARRGLGNADEID